MPAFEPQDFLAALNRPYESQVKFDAQLRELKERQERTDVQLAEVGAYVRETSELARLTNEQMQHTDAGLDQLVALVKSHESQLHRLEGQAS